MGVCDDVQIVVGHEFKRRTSKRSKHYCEKCASVIWGVMQAWYKCNGTYSGIKPLTCFFILLIGTDMTYHFSVDVPLRI